MKRKTVKKMERGWAIVDSNKKILFESIRDKRGRSVYAFFKETGIWWEHAYSQGFRCVRVEIKYEVRV